MDDFITPPDHKNFLACKLFGDIGQQIVDGAIAYLKPDGGGPVVPHTHAHNPLFIVVKGEARIELGDRTVILKQNDSFLVDGAIPHSVWNQTGEETVIVGISTKPGDSPTPDPDIRKTDYR